MGGDGGDHSRGAFERRRWTAGETLSPDSPRVGPGREFQMLDPTPTDLAGPTPHAESRRAVLRRLAGLGSAWLVGQGVVQGQERGAGPDENAARAAGTETAEQSAGGPVGWTEFRGPTGQGQVPVESRIPLRWSESQNVAWKVPVVGKGWSSPVIDRGTIWLTTASTGGRSLRVVGLDAQTGKSRVITPAIFEVDPRAKGLARAGNAAPTPVVAGERVFVHFGAHGTACLDQRGQVVWKRVVPYYHHHGPGNSPVLVGDTLVLVCDGFTGPFFDKYEREGVTAPQFVIGLDADTGETRWQTPRDGKHSYATPLAVECGGATQVVCPGGDGVYGYDPVDGREVWQCRFEGHSLVPRPVTSEQFLFVCTGYHQASLLAFRWDDLAQGGAVTPAWKISSGVPFVSSPLVVDDLLLFVSDDGILSCVSAETGKPVWKQRLGGQFSASPIAQGKRVYLGDEEGTTYVFEAGPRYRELARNSLPGKVLASPAVYADRLYVRTETHLYCLAEGGQEGDSVRLTGGEQPVEPARTSARPAGRPAP